MKIHSDTLTFHDILTCVPAGCYLALAPDAEGFTGIHGIHSEGSRSRRYGFRVRLSGSSRYTMANLPDKAATWDEWGIFIAALFRRDPNALIGHYPTKNNFIDQTANERDRIAEHRPDLAPTHRAPWLAAMIHYG